MTSWPPIFLQHYGFCTVVDVCYVFQFPWLGLVIDKGATNVEEAVLESLLQGVQRECVRKQFSQIPESKYTAHHEVKVQVGLISYFSSFWDSLNPGSWAEIVTAGAIYLHALWPNLKYGFFPPFSIVLANKRWRNGSLAEHYMHAWRKWSTTIADVPRLGGHIHIFNNCLKSWSVCNSKHLIEGQLLFEEGGWHAPLWDCTLLKNKKPSFHAFVPVCMHQP